MVEKLKMNSVVFTLLILFTFNSFGQHTLVIEINDLRSNSGHILLQLFDEDQKTINDAVGNIKDGTSVITFENLKQSLYAFRYFHDENDNDEMETNWMGIPKEGFGFSNNAKGTFGPPAFKKWLFQVNEESIMRESQDLMGWRSGAAPRFAAS